MLANSSFSFKLPKRSVRPLILLLPILVLAGFACRDATTGPQAPSLSLVVEDVESTEVFIHCTAVFNYANARILLKRNGQTIMTFDRAALDTVVLDDSLAPHSTYSYIAYKELDLVAVDSSNRLSVTSLDTTSHTFVWRVDTLGDGSSSIFRDVSIIAGNNIWAVGEAYLKDSVGNFDPLPYNVAQWDGAKWSLKRVTVQHLGQDVTPPLFGIFSYSAFDIWLSAGVPIHGDGETWSQYHLFDMGVLGPNDGGILHIWGTDDRSKVFFAGRKGSIVTFDGSNWLKLASGVSTGIQDVYGVVNQVDNSYESYFTVSDPLSGGEVQIIRFNSRTERDTIPTPGQNPLNSTWSKSSHVLLTGGAGLFERKQDSWTELHALPNYYVNRIRGQGLNDIFVVGDYGLVGHFNGATWKTFPQFSLPDGTYEGLAFSQNAVVAVGQVGNRAIILLGVRN